MGPAVTGESCPAPHAGLKGAAECGRDGAVRCESIAGERAAAPIGIEVSPNTLAGPLRVAELEFVRPGGMPPGPAEQQLRGVAARAAPGYLDGADPRHREILGQLAAPVL